MRVDAERATGAAWAAANDPRVTLVGRLLRAHRLDELPQLTSVLTGDMNVVSRLLIASTNTLTIRTFLLPYAHHFRSLGWEVDALASGDMSIIAPAFDRTFPIQWSTRVTDLGRALFAAPEAVRRCVAARRYDIVHVHTPIAGFVARAALRRLERERKPKVIYTAHGFLFHRGSSGLQHGLFLGAEQLAGRWTDYLVVINREDASAARRHRLVPDHRIRVMPGVGIDVGKYASGATATAIAKAKAAAGLSPRTPYVLCIAEFRPVKRHGDVLKAFASAVRTPACGELELVLVGNGPLLERSRRTAERLGIAQRTRFVGFRDDVNVLLAGARALVLASEREGLPRCVLEAMAARVPVVATDVRGTSELLAGGKGTLVPAKDPDALGAALEKVMSAPARLRRSVEGAFRSLKRYELARVLAMHETLYEEALSLTPIEAAAPPGVASLSSRYPSSGHARPKPSAAAGRPCESCSPLP